MIVKFSLTVPRLRDKTRKERMEYIKKISETLSEKLLASFEQWDEDEAWQETLDLMHEMNIQHERNKNAK